MSQARELEVLQQIEEAFDSPGSLRELQKEIASDGDLTDAERARLDGRCGQYIADEEKSFDAS